jgi:hypothetical protein
MLRNASRSAVFAAAMLCALPAFGAWKEYRSGPFRVFSNAGDKAARERLNWLEQSRHVLTTLLSRKEIQPEWPIYVALFKTQREAAAYQLPVPLMPGRTAYWSVLSADVPVSAAWKRAVVARLLDATANPWEEGLRDALLDLFTTFEATGPVLSLGGPVSNPSPGWARLQYIAATPEMYGTFRVFLNNIDQGGDLDVACRNAWGRGLKEIDKEAAAYLAAGRIGSGQPNGRALNPNRDFRELDFEDAQLKVLQADLLLCNPARVSEARNAFAALNGVEKEEGQGLAALAGGDKAAARRHLKAATALDGVGARAWYELALLEEEAVTAKMAFEQAIKLNPGWSEPHAQITATLQNPGVQAQAWKAAAQLRPGETRYWIALAEALEKAQNFNEAGRAWGMAERAAGREEAEKMRARRRESVEARAAFVEEQRRKAREEEQRELDRLKEEAVAELRAAEEAANRRLAEQRGGAPLPANVEKWWDDPKAAATVQGTLERVDCLSPELMRLAIRVKPGQVVTVALRDAKKVTASASGKLSCGPQKPARRAKVTHSGQPDPKLGTVGDAVTIEIQ